jgi:hypothetical protein
MPVYPGAQRIIAESLIDMLTGDRNVGLQFTNLGHIKAEPETLYHAPTAFKWMRSIPNPSVNT